ncbi:MAG: NmrA family NAD(P)-binding protein [Bacteroidota bacterium]|nr:NmrA family NAD(P)-binding protein [Bacteroidota bacterium]
MKKILITGATGNVGMAVIKSLNNLSHSYQIITGVKDLDRDKEKLAPYKVEVIYFDFTDISSYEIALKSCTILFLLRPPNIAQVTKYYKPLIEKTKEIGIKHIVFLSVQGVEKNTIIPHHKIETLIVQSNIAYTFLRPAYFMQNFIGSLHYDLVVHKKIFLPAGRAKFTLVDVHDIGNVAAVILINTTKYLNKTVELTSNEKLSFKEMAIKLSSGLGILITYESPNLFKFYLTKRKENLPFMLIMVMIMLHFLPRFSKEPKITEEVKNIVGNEPITFSQFIEHNKTILTA